MIHAGAAAVGLRVHSGWTAAVVVAGSVREPVVLERRRLETADPNIRGSKHLFHAAGDMTLAKARDLVERCERATRELARRSLHDLIAGTTRSGRPVAACGVLVGAGGRPGSLEEILASHARIHSAEGWFFRDAMQEAAEHAGLAVTAVVERELAARAAAAAGEAPDVVTRRVAALGRTLGPPWRQDEKLATLVALLALHAHVMGARSGRSERPPRA